jgi:glycolate oxidase FAD binding subunit
MSDITTLLQEQISQSALDLKKLCVIGQGSKSFVGRLPVGDPLSMTDHYGIVSYKPVELVVTVRAGTSLRYLASTLAENNQMLAFDPPMFDGKGTVGGAVASNLAGSARPWLGAVRDSILGVKIINGRGQLLNFGGQVLKNVAGYDVSRLQAGAMGTLGVISEVSFRVQPLPEIDITLSKQVSADEAINIMNKVAGTSVPLTGACWYNNTLYLRLSGARESTELVAKKWRGEVTRNNSIWSDINNHELTCLRNPQELWQFCLKSTTPHFLQNYNWLIDWCGGRRLLSISANSIPVERELLENYAQKYSGSVCLLKGGNRSNEYFPILAKPLQIIHRRIKESFDPKGILNAGRMYAWL